MAEAARSSTTLQVAMSIAMDGCLKRFSSVASLITKVHRIGALFLVPYKQLMISRPSVRVRIVICIEMKVK